MNQQTILGIGILVVFIGIVIIILSSFLTNKNVDGKSKTESKIAVVGFFGPIPFGFGNDKEMLKWGLVVGVIILILIFIGLRFG